MWYEFPADDECWSVESESQFMFGPDWLVAPVLAANASSRSVYLPWLPGNEAWLHHYSQQYHDGGQRLDIAVTLADFPLFQRVVTNPPATTE
jgi:alpha-D-xyloside xylohydrolase